MVEEKEEIGQRLWYRRKGGDWSEAMVQKKRRRLVRGYVVEEKEEIGQRLWYRRKVGDWPEALLQKKRRRLARGYGTEEEEIGQRLW